LPLFPKHLQELKQQFLHLESFHARTHTHTQSCLQILSHSFLNISNNCCFHQNHSKSMYKFQMVKNVGYLINQNSPNIEETSLFILGSDKGVRQNICHTQDFTKRTNSNQQFQHVHQCFSGIWH
jgi:hypothetical protein